MGAGVLHHIPCLLLSAKVVGCFWGVVIVPLRGLVDFGDVCVWACIVYICTITVFTHDYFVRDLLAQGLSDALNLGIGCPLKRTAIARLVLGLSRLCIGLLWRRGDSL